MKPEIQVTAFSLKRVMGLLISSSLAWLWLASNRKMLIQKPCLENSSLCSPENVWPIDRWAVHAAHGQIDFWSFVTQDVAGGFAVLTICIYVFLNKETLRTLGRSFIVLLACAGLNGALTEFCRIFTHRPRPFVYVDLATMAADPAHYTSFYSGHTSFTAAIGVCTLLLLRNLGASEAFLRRYGILAAGLMLATGTFRVLAGRHFPTDVLGGMVFGSLARLIAFRWSKIRQN